MKKLLLIALIIATSGVLNSQNIRIKNTQKTKPNNKGNILKQNTLRMLKIELGDKTIYAGEGIEFSGKNPNYKISGSDKVTVTAGEGIVIKGKYPNYIVEQKKHYIGEHYLGGIVFYVEENGQHGLIAGKFFNKATWSTFHWGEGKKGNISWKDFNTLGVKGSGIGAGKFNTTKMLSNDPFNNIVDIGEDRSIPQILIKDFSDWYLPSIMELELIYKQKHILKDILKITDEQHILWSSTEGGSIWKGHKDDPRGRNYATGKYYTNENGIAVKLVGEHEASNGGEVRQFFDDAIGASKGLSTVTGVSCINFYTGRVVYIAKTHGKPFVLIRRF